MDQYIYIYIDHISEQSQGYFGFGDIVFPARTAAMEKSTAERFDDQSTIVFIPDYWQEGSCRVLNRLHVIAPPDESTTRHASCQS